ncbi:MAG: hypothetical protein AUK35_11175 [Zetaproteobacteria bacterium CG2_30_46_52]|nr:MAG: hypothetical protein AUK35_11175 [Zetaproteobacteria bacterium CG2_30_46_52]
MKKIPEIEAGFTLLETLITMVIAAIALLATAQMLMVSIQYNKKNEQKFDSSAVVQSMLQEANFIVTNDAECDALKADWAARARVNSYLDVDYVEEVTCTILTSEQRYMIQAEIRDAANNLVGSGRSILTTVVPTE